MTIFGVHIGRYVAVAIVAALIVGVGLYAWLKTYDAGLVVSVAFASLYIALFTAGLPDRRWVMLPQIRGKVDASADNIRFLETPCLVDPCDHHPIERRHLHFSECLRSRTLEMLVRAYGFSVIADSFVRDVRYQWLFGVLSTGFMTFVFVAMARPTPTPAAFDTGRAAVAAVVGLFHICASAYGLIWFRKQGEQLGLP